MNDFPMTVSFAYQEKQSRLITFFKIILSIPWLIFAALWSFAFQIVMVIVWFAILFTGKYPEGLFSFSLKFVRFSTRYNYWTSNLTDRWPPFNGQPGSEYGVTLDITRQEKYSRVKSFFRMVLAIPLALLAFGVVFYLEIFYFLGWWSIIFTGRMPKWCYQHIADTFAWQTRTNAYMYLLIEKFPPFKGQD